MWTQAVFMQIKSSDMDLIYWILQAQANANQEQEALRAEKLRKEQLALRQSKQLIPVLASGKPKQSSNVPQSPGLALRKSAGAYSLVQLCIKPNCLKSSSIFKRDRFSLLAKTSETSYGLDQPIKAQNWMQIF